jgi:DNA topoisomerase I
MNNLIIVESPTKAKTLGKFLGKDYTVDATMGHIMDLPKSKLSVDIEHDFEPLYIPMEKKLDTIKRIQREAKKASHIFIATDPDREGEAIAAHVERILSGKEIDVVHILEKSEKTNAKKANIKLEKDGKKGKTQSAKKNVIEKLIPPVKKDIISRIVFHEITKTAVEEAIAHPRHVDGDLVDAQIGRRVLDRLVGYKLSPLLWKKVRRGLSAGRVQSVAVRLIVEKEREILAFKPVEYWEIGAQLKVQNAKSKVKEFIVNLSKIEGKKAEVHDGKSANQIVADLEKAKYSVFDIKKREVHKHPYAPFTTSTMSQAGARMFGWSAKRTMSLAQKLYEEGLITYHRTDSTNIAAQAIDMARTFIVTKYGNEYLPEKPNYYKTNSKVAQEAHEAIRPTSLELVDAAKWEGNGKNGLDTTHKKLYELIRSRFLACQMKDSVYDETSIDVLAQAIGNRHKAIDEKSKGKTNAQPLVPSAYTLHASGQIMKFDGWRKVMPTPKNANAKNSNEEGDQDLPLLEKDEALDLIKVLSEQKFTQPPARFNEASLIKMLEKLGIGRPSTYAPIISTIQARTYVEKTEGKFFPTAVGMAANDFLVTNFPEELEYSFTAQMEGDLDNVANGKRQWQKMMKEFYTPFEKKLGKVEKDSDRVKIATESTGKKCPKCKEGEIVVRTGRFGKFLSCSRFPDCDYKDKYLQKIDIKCPTCKTGDIVVKKTGKGRIFYGCSRYPECDYASWKDPRPKKAFDEPQGKVDSSEE